AVGEDRSTPRGESMQSAERTHHVLAGAQVQVISVAEDDPRTGALELVGMKAAHRAVSANRHEAGSLHRAMWQGECPGAGRALIGLEFELVHSARLVGVTQ